MKINSLVKVISSVVIGVFTISCDDVYKQQVEVKSQTYFPISADSDDCMRYRKEAITQISTQVILYKAINGGYTPNKSESNCR